MRGSSKACEGKPARGISLPTILYVRQRRAFVICGFCENRVERLQLMFEDLSYQLLRFFDLLLVDFPLGYAGRGTQRVKKILRFSKKKVPRVSCAQEIDTENTNKTLMVSGKFRTRG